MEGRLTLIVCCVVALIVAALFGAEVWGKVKKRRHKRHRSPKIFDGIL